MATSKKEFASFAEFYPFYLSQHQNSTCRYLHYIGSSLVLLLLAFCLFTQSWFELLLLPILGYGFAWVGHFVFEKNKPATFQYPLYSFIGDWVMLWHWISGRKN
ncbi:MAG: Mpo1-like protein [Parashewanella sp.]